MRRLRDDDDDRSEEGFRARKQRKQRPCFSCAECRRLKMNGRDPASRPGNQKDSQHEQLQEDLEHLTQRSEHQGRPDPEGQRQAYQGPMQPEATDHENDPPFDPNTNRTHHIPSHATLSDSIQVNPLTLLAHALEPYTTQGPSPHTPASRPYGGLGESAHSINTGTSASSNAARYPVDDDQQNGSYGTLMLGKRGRSKYLGPTAGSEWLKESETQDVPDTPCMTRAPSPTLPQGLLASQRSVLSLRTAVVRFLFSAPPTHISTRELLACLPSRDKARTLVESQLDEGRRGDSAWPLWGLVMRLIQAMGMHRDGDRWNLPKDVVEERRKVFWECNSADIFQAHCFSRPSAINPEHCDTAFPSEPVRPNGEKSYSILRFELSQLSSEILNMAMKVRRPAYSEVTDLDLRLYVLFYTVRALTK
ncbi:hypothetical protein CEP53_001841 [Fusarium sp. AF-6]|nr:hypothetical protein CEP53_001841 [Fusarium sp. AF-6]